jgi:hypothetical protein
LVLLAYKWFANISPEKRKKYLKHAAIAMGIILLLGLAVRGGAYQSAVVGAVGLTLLRVLPYLAQRFLASKLRDQAPPGENAPPPPPRPGQMTRGEALEILGLSDGATRDQILERYKQLIKSNHPDRGGSDYLASQINRAKDTLVG